MSSGRGQGRLQLAQGMKAKRRVEGKARERRHDERIEERISVSVGPFHRK
jgi:hypothetical protein